VAVNATNLYRILQAKAFSVSKNIKDIKQGNLQCIIYLNNKPIDVETLLKDNFITELKLYFNCKE
jgi:hypothetical protein